MALRKRLTRFRVVVLNPVRTERRVTKRRVLPRASRLKRQREPGLRREFLSDEGAIDCNSLERRLEREILDEKFLGRMETPAAEWTAQQLL